MIQALYFGEWAKITKENKVSNRMLKFRVINYNNLVFSINEETEKNQKEKIVKLDAEYSTLEN